MKIRTTITITEQELKEIKAKAKESKRSVSAYFVHCALNAK